MKIYNFDQGGEEWRQVKLGKISASTVKSLLTPTGQSSKAATRRRYLVRLLTEKMINEPCSFYVDREMERGKELEPEAIAAYVFENDAEVERVGFIELNEFIGCSPDGLVGDDGLLEIKCPAPDLLNVYRLDGVVPPEYMPQVQFQLYCTKRKWCDFYAYHPMLPAFQVRAFPDPDYQKKLDEVVTEAIEDLKKIKENLDKSCYPEVAKI